MTEQKSEIKQIETIGEVKNYLDKLRFMINKGNANIYFEFNRAVDRKRAIKYRNVSTILDIFPDEDPKTAVVPLLLKLSVENYIETVKDTRFPKRDDFRVFGIYHDKGELYIKIRVQLLDPQKLGLTNCIFIMSFHYSTIKFKEDMFPYR